MRFGRLILAGTAILLLAIACGHVVRTQHQEQRPVRYDWAHGYEDANRLALTGLVLLAADPAIEALRRRRRGRVLDAPTTADDGDRVAPR